MLHNTLYNHMIKRINVRSTIKNEHRNDANKPAFFAAKVYW